MGFTFYECEHSGDVEYAIEGIQKAGFSGIKVDRHPTFYNSDDEDGTPSARISFDVPDGMTRGDVRARLEAQEGCCL